MGKTGRKNSRGTKELVNKDEFMASISHEIRTPLNAIIGLTKLLQKTPLNEEQQKYLTSIERSGDILMTIINDILDLAKIDAGKINFDPYVFSLRESLRYVLELMNEKAIGKGIVYQWHINDNVKDSLYGDPVRLSQVMINLIGNAIKFTNKGYVRVIVSQVSQDDGKVEIEFSVRDTGIGIADDKIDEIFGSFTQVHADHQKYGGTGLGLAIVKKLLELQGGNIEVESTLNKGSTFKVRIPFAIPEPENKKRKKNRQDKSLHNKKALVIEDNEINVLIIRKALQEFGMEAIVAKTGAEALSLIKGKYDIILLDLLMPDVNGYDIADKLRSMKSEVAKTPVLALTAYNVREHVDKCIMHGINDLLLKPFNTENLFIKIKALAGSGKLYNNEPPSILKTMMENNQLLDLKFLKNLSEGDSAFINEVASMFIDTIPGAIAAMLHDVEIKDWKNLKLTAHKVKSSFGFLGIHVVEEIMRKIERGCEYPDSDYLYKLVHEASDLAGKSISALKEEVYGGKV